MKTKISVNFVCEIDCKNQLDINTFLCDGYLCTRSVYLISQELIKVAWLDLLFSAKLEE